MRFFRNCARHQAALSETLGVVYIDNSSSIQSSDSDPEFPGDVHGFEYPQGNSDDQDFEGPEYAGNENTPINQLPNEILGYIFELGMLEFKRLHQSKPESKALGVDEYWVYTIYDENLENNERTRYLTAVGVVCRAWLLVAGPICCAHVVVDGHLEDYMRASVVLSNSYPGMDCSKGSLVRHLRLDINEDYIYGDLEVVKSIISILKLCPNLLKLIIRNESGFGSLDIQEIWQEGITACTSNAGSSLRFLSWTVANLDAISLNLPQYFMPFMSLTELDLRDEDEGYTMKECDAVSLPRLRTYRLRARSSVILRHQASWSMSSVENISLTFEESRNSDSDNEFDNEAAKLFFDAHGQHLRYLKLNRLPTNRDLVMALLDSSPKLEHLDLNINLINFDSGFLRHDNVDFIKVSGARIDGEDGREKSMGQYLIRFLNTQREHSAFPRVNKIMFEYLRQMNWAVGFDASVKNDWQKWFALDASARPQIVDGDSHPFTIAEALTDVDRSFRVRRV